MPSDSQLISRPPNVDDAPPGTGDVPPQAFPRLCHRVANSVTFQWMSTAIIILNAVVIGAGTYDAMAERFGTYLAFLDNACLAYFVLELTIRVIGFGTMPWRFFGNGWNVFDFLVIGSALLPGLRENVTLLRLARTVRLMKFFPSLRILLTAVWRSLPGALGLIGVRVVVLYLYGMLG